jgi:hypothetical protein
LNHEQRKKKRYQVFICYPNLQTFSVKEICFLNDINFTPFDYWQLCYK